MRAARVLAVAIAIAGSGTSAARAQAPAPAPAPARAPTPNPTPTSTSTPTSTATPTLPPASPRAVHTRLTTAAPKLGEPFDYEVEIRHPTAEAYAPDGKPDFSPLDAEPLGCQRATAPGATGDSLTTCRWRLRTFDLAPRDLPAVAFQATTADGPRALSVPGPRVEATGLIDPAAPPDQLQLRPPAPPVPLMVRSWRLAWWTLGILAALAAAALAWRWWRRRARAAAEPPPPLPPDLRFERRLDLLAAARPADPAAARAFFFGLSEAVREYVGALTGVNALDLTTAELADALATQGDPRLDLARLRDFCEDADLVKFAKFPAGAAECEAGLRYGRELLQGTRGWWSATAGRNPIPNPYPTSIPTSIPTPTPTSTSTSTSTSKRDPPRRLP